MFVMKSYRPTAGTDISGERSAPGKGSPFNQGGANTTDAQAEASRKPNQLLGR
jgi:hypothetical protein